MTYGVDITKRAWQDARKIVDWISERSPQGADSWTDALMDAIETVRNDPERYPAAEEAHFLDGKVCQAIFHTHKGRKYRFLFEIRESIVVILSVRGPGQSPVKPEDLAEDT
jgi:plasmid stabilization system protein ParE